MTKINLIDQQPSNEEIIKRKNFKKVIGDHAAQQSAMHWTKRWSIWKSASIGAAVVGGALLYLSEGKNDHEPAYIEVTPKQLRLQSDAPQPILEQNVTTVNYTPEQAKTTSTTSLVVKTEAITEKQPVEEQHTGVKTSNNSLNLPYPVEEVENNFKIMINRQEQSNIYQSEITKLKDVAILNTESMSAEKVKSFDLIIHGKTYHVAGSFFNGPARRAILTLEPGDSLEIKNVKFSENTLEKGEVFKII